MPRPKSVKISSKVEIIEPVGYMQSTYIGKIGDVIKIEDDIAFVKFDVILRILLSNLKVLK